MPANAAGGLYPIDEPPHALGLYGWEEDKLTDYEERRIKDRAKLQSMVSYCQSAQCRTRFLLEYFGEPAAPDWVCGNCDACDAQRAWTERTRRAVALA